jgi:prevent-host-death family protein
MTAGQVLLVAITATKLRADLYRVIEYVITKGVPVEVELRGRKVRIVPAEPRDKLAGLVKRPGVIVGDPRRLPRVKTFDERKWRKKWAKRLK